MQQRRDSIANTPEKCPSCTNPLICWSCIQIKPGPRLNNDMMTWKCFPSYWPSVWAINGWLVVSPSKKKTAIWSSDISWCQTNNWVSGDLILMWRCSNASLWFSLCSVYIRGLGYKTIVWTGCFILFWLNTINFGKWDSLCWIDNVVFQGYLCSYNVTALV